MPRKKKEIEMYTEEDLNYLKLLCNMREDYQKQRIKFSNRLGIKKDNTMQDVPSRGVSDVQTAFLKDCLKTLSNEEDVFEKEIKKILPKFPIYNSFLKDVKGIGPALAGLLIANIDIKRAKYVSNIWQFAGFNPALVRGQKDIPKSKYKEQLGEVVLTYFTITEGKEEERVRYLTNDLVKGDRLTPGYCAPFNSKLRAILIGKIATSFMMSNSSYKVNVYEPYKHRLENSENWKDKSAGHRNNAAKRYMMKMFIQDLYVAWRTVEGLEVAKPYHEEKLGHKHTVKRKKAE